MLRNDPAVLINVDGRKSGRGILDIDIQKKTEKIRGTLWAN